MDTVNVERRRGCLMKNVPKFLVGPFRSVLRLVLQEIQATDLGRYERGWKLFLLALRMLLFRRPRGGSISREKLTDRFAKFARGAWTELLAWSLACADEGAVASRRRQRRPEHQEELRAARALVLVQLGELSSERQALEGAALHRMRTRCKSCSEDQVYPMHPFPEICLR